MSSDNVPTVGPPTGISSQTHDDPPHPLDADWKMRVDGQTYGPYSGHQLEGFVTEGRLELHTEVQRAGGGDWLPAQSDTTLARLFAKHHLPPATSRRGSSEPPITAGDRSTIVNVHNSVSTPYLAGVVDVGADKSPGVALLLSLLLVGGGQMYNGEVGKGFLMLFGCILLWVVFLGWIINIWSMIDAYSHAKTLRNKYQLHLAQVRAM